MKLPFSEYAASVQNEVLVAREKPLYNREGDLRSPFLRDYTRIIHSSAFRRLKHKTQAFFSPQSDHICTRIEHVLYVESIGSTISERLGLNSELVRAIAVSHDLGHPPFGHKGEVVINEISKRDIGESFWHEKNSLFFVDKIELLENDERKKENLNLTYAVRDGIISHCGESNAKSLFTRDESCCLYDFKEPNTFSPYTFEACVVKAADQISYIGRDIEDAVSLKVLDESRLRELSNIISPMKGDRINNTIIINYLITDICNNSTPEKGITFSKETSELVDKLREFNTRNIYRVNRVKMADKYFSLIINQIYETLKDCYDGEQTEKRLNELGRIYENLPVKFLNWLKCYWSLERDHNLKNEAIYDMTSQKDYCRAILHYIAGMTDKYAIDTYNEIISF